MSGWDVLGQLLHTDPRDVGCDETLRLLDVWVDLLLDGLDPAALMPGMAAHLRACDPCADDLTGLLAAAGGAAPPPATGRRSPTPGRTPRSR